MNTERKLVARIISRFWDRGFAQVEGYNKFGFVQVTRTTIVVSREKGEDTAIPYAKMEKAIIAVRTDPTVYDRGPNALREHGITFVNSPIWSLIHLLPRRQIAGR